MLCKQLEAVWTVVIEAELSNGPLSPLWQSWGPASDAGDIRRSLRVDYIQPRGIHNPLGKTMPE